MFKAAFNTECHQCVSKTRGFTLLEILVVLVIIGILAAVAAPALINVSDDADRAQVQSVAGAFRAAVKLVQTRFLQKGYTTRVQDLPGFGLGNVDTNNLGFPIGTNKGNANQNIGVGNSGCQGVWDGILSTNLSATTSANSDFQTFRHTANQVCSYVYRKNGDTAARTAALLVIQYDSRDGQVYLCGTDPELSACPF